jgi:hypothetical protein
MSRFNTPQTIKLSDLRLALASAKLRQLTQGRTCLLAAITPAPMLRADCSSRGRMLLRSGIAEYGMTRCHVGPIDRGHITALIERTRNCHGLPEVRKTWGAGLRTLLAEPRYVLNGGAA